MSTELCLLNEEQLKARDAMAEYLRLRLDHIISMRIDKLIESFIRGEPEGVEEIKWEWNLSIKGQELEDLKELARTIRGE